MTDLGVAGEIHGATYLPGYAAAAAAAESWQVGAGAGGTVSSWSHHLGLLPPAGQPQYAELLSISAAAASAVSAAHAHQSQSTAAPPHSLFQPSAFLPTPVQVAIN